jgi:hypothetical protein
LKIDVHSYIMKRDTTKMPENTTKISAVREDIEPFRLMDLPAGKSLPEFIARLALM